MQPSVSHPDLRHSYGLALALDVQTHTGHVRANNEDSHRSRWLDDGSLLVAVCDGMGGHEAGEVASRIAVDTVEDVVTRADPTDAPQQVLYDALMAANRAILAEAKAIGRKGMGTTAVLGLVRGERVYVALIGDSRLYHIRDGHLVERTRDHTRVEARLQRGEISEAEARDHPEAGILTRALGHERMANRQPLEPEVFAQPLYLEGGDALVLSTDGLHDLVEDWEIAAVVAGTTAVKAAPALVRLALSRGGHDNVTVAVVTVGVEAAPMRTEPHPIGKSLVDAKTIPPDTDTFAELEAELESAREEPSFAASAEAGDAPGDDADIDWPPQRSSMADKPHVMVILLVSSGLLLAGAGLLVIALLGGG